MTPLLQTILLGTPAEPPENPPSTRKHTFLGQQHKAKKNPPGESAAIMRETLTGAKWWSIADLAQRLGQPNTTLYTNLSRYRSKFNIESFVISEAGHQVKYYRIKP